MKEIKNENDNISFLDKENKENFANERRDDVYEKIKNEITSLRDDLSRMVLTDQTGISDELSYLTPIKLRQEKFLPELINQLSYSFIGKNSEDGRISFFRELSRKLSSDDISRMVNARNIFIFGNLAQENLLYQQKLLHIYLIKNLLKKLILLMYQVLVRRIQIFYDLTAEFWDSQ